ncbi:small acid-soluble spore protein Tlp [Papillibacter cinnamivorans]|jgi:small acid-soluble spore protein (thioredoxin-like protein)|uniref:Protein Tlp homolog n=1 Tax=Papillibacter cinnamivorans DSM 12816 TaxID=1122930 RepID=A0A1W1ZHK0_9FIRM|nr:small acid-soluble spore protein Tlp [Papillibacter cinnamivorans]SMC48015.1 small acid-soluble spore protein (thioredoxin-like protein) [Papillibacter cinnamivorans DSM 12816]
MKHNPDDRRDNAERIQKNIGATLRKMEAADELMAKTHDEKKERELREKNERREEALRGMRREIKEEAEYSRRQGKDPSGRE